MVMTLVMPFNTILSQAKKSPLDFSFKVDSSNKVFFITVDLTNITNKKVTINWSENNFNIGKCDSLLCVKIYLTYGNKTIVHKKSNIPNYESVSSNILLASKEKFSFNFEIAKNLNSVPLRICILKMAGFVLVDSTVAKLKFEKILLKLH